MTINYVKLIIFFFKLRSTFIAFNKEKFGKICFSNKLYFSNEKKILSVYFIL